LGIESSDSKEPSLPPRLTMPSIRTTILWRAKINSATIRNVVNINSIPMKAFYLTASIICTVLLLILSFENIGSQCTNLLFFFYEFESSPTIIFLGVAVIGIITGVFYHSFLQKVMETPEDEEEENL
jgi:uncharacterized integral membrane protein